MAKEPNQHQTVAQTYPRLTATRACQISSACFEWIARCPLLAQSGHFATEFQCPLFGVKRTLIGSAAMSAFDPKQTLTPLLARPALLEIFSVRTYSDQAASIHRSPARDLRRCWKVPSC